MLAVRLRRRGSGWAWPAADLPFALLLLGDGLALFLALRPIPLHQP